MRHGNSWIRTLAIGLKSAAIASMILVTGETASAQDYPSRPITMIVPFPPGGGSDIVGRVIAEHMRTSLGQPVIIENVPGAAGSIGTGRVARAAPDGYTLVLGNLATHVVNGATLPLKYDVLKDFEPISLLAHEPMLLLARKTLPASDLKGLIAWLKANPDNASAGTLGPGAGNHISFVHFQRQTGTRFQLVPYRGSVVSGLLAGDVDLAMEPASNSLAQVRAGGIKTYAVMAKSRLPAAPDIPTVDEAGLPGFYVTPWFGLWAPKGTPKTVIAKLNRAVADALSDSNVRARLAAPGQEIFPREQLTPEALAAYQKAESEKWWPLVKAAGVKVQ